MFNIKLMIPCCKMVTMDTSKNAVKLVGITNILISILTITITVIMKLKLLPYPDMVVMNEPYLFISVLFGLVATFLSLYQFFIAALLVWHARQPTKYSYLFSFWNISNIGITTFYVVFLTTRIIVCFYVRNYVSAMLTLCPGYAYVFVLVFSSITVNRYLNSLEFGLGLECDIDNINIVRGVSGR